MWNMINIKSPHTGYSTNDPNRNPFCDKSDERLVYICKVATTFKRMDNSPKGRRMHSLTAGTSNALHQTLSGLVALIKYKLDVGFKYVLPRKDQSDRIEAEFSIYLQEWWKLLYINLSSVQWLEVTANKTVSSIGNVRKAAHQCKRPML